MEDPDAVLLEVSLYLSYDLWYAGLIEELGPFHVSDFGNTVYLNKYAWNTVSAPLEA